MPRLTAAERDAHAFSLLVDTSGESDGLVSWVMANDALLGSDTAMVSRRIAQGASPVDAVSAAIDEMLNRT